MNSHTKVGIVDYGVGNIGSIINMLKKNGVLNLNVLRTPKDFDLNPEKIILPGVGSFDNAIKKIESNFSLSFLKEKILSDKIPTLGICLGMQILTKSSEEGSLNGLGLIDAETKKINISNNSSLKVPHMGWNYVTKDNESFLTDGLDNTDFYFVHSYFVECRNPRDSILRTNFHIPFTSAFQCDNIYGVQFHPEKSHKHGMKLLKNFIDLC